MTERYVRVLKEPDGDPLAELARLIGQASPDTFPQPFRGLSPGQVPYQNIRPDVIADAIFYPRCTLSVEEELHVDDVLVHVWTFLDDYVPMPTRDAFYYRPHVHAFHIAKN